MLEHHPDRPLADLRRIFRWCLFRHDNPSFSRSGASDNPGAVQFGLTGGLIPCPAAITVLLLCLQLKEVAPGGVLVLCFSIGLALTLMSAGVVAALGVRHAERRWSGAFGRIARQAPYVSGALILAVGLYVGFHGLSGLGYHLAGSPSPSSAALFQQIG
nr:sulfite exporter TauE/SafE family protein [Azospirillum sp. B510]